MLMMLCGCMAAHHMRGRVDRRATRRQAPADGVDGAGMA